MTDALLQEQELGNQQRRELARLLVLAEVARGQFGPKPAEAIRRLEAGVRSLTRLTNSNSPATRTDIVDELVSGLGVTIAPSVRTTLINSVRADEQGTYDVIPSEKFQSALAQATRAASPLTTSAIADIRSADLIDRDTSFTAAAVHTLGEPFIWVVLALAAAFYWWSRRTPRTDDTGAAGSRGTG